MRATDGARSSASRAILPEDLASLRSRLEAFRAWLKAAAFDPGDLSDAQRRDVGIDPCDVERIRALKRSLIR